MGETLRGNPARGRRGRGAVAIVLIVCSVVLALGRAAAQDRAEGLKVTGDRYERGRFRVYAEPKDVPLARAILQLVTSTDTFPGLPRPQDTVTIVIARDARQFREYAGPEPPEWGSAFAFPARQLIVMQGSRAPSSAGDPRTVIRHELAHLALHEFMGDLPPRWFDEGYASVAANEWGREEVLATNLALALRGVPPLAALDSGFYAGASMANASYALAHRAVTELAALDPERGLTLLFQYWPRAKSLDVAVREAYGITLGQYEKLWRERTRRRYGALALFADLTVGALVSLVVIIPLYIGRRRRNRARLEAMRTADAEQERREGESAQEAMLQTPVVAPESNGEEGGGNSSQTSESISRHTT